MITINPRLSSKGGAWDDLRREASANNINSASTRYRFDYDEIQIEFDDDARIANERIVYTFQMPHAWIEGSPVDPHFHWWQANILIPNWFLEFRKYNNGAARPAVWTPLIHNKNKFPYTSGEIMQITDFPDIPMDGIKVSGFIDIRFGRDTGNVSTEFAGADPLTGIALFKEFDLHILSDDSRGSLGEYTKHNY